MTNISAAEIAKMTAREVASLADLDRWSVRDEGFRRQEVAEKALAAAKRALARAEAAMAEAAAIINAAEAEARRAA